MIPKMSLEIYLRRHVCNRGECKHVCIRGGWGYGYVSMSMRRIGVDECGMGGEGRVYRRGLHVLNTSHWSSRVSVVHRSHRV